VCVTLPKLVHPPLVSKEEEISRLEQLGLDMLTPEVWQFMLIHF
jgi:hypothetical protein